MGNLANKEGAIEHGNNIQEANSFAWRNIYFHVIADMQHSSLTQKGATKGIFDLHVVQTRTPIRAFLN